MSKPQLTTYSKALLLMHRSEYVCRRPEDDNTTSTFEFFKYLLISRDFLRASQLYRVYHFAIFEYCNDDNKFYVSAVGRNAVGAWATEFKLTLEEIQTWNRLLKVQYMYLSPCEYEHAGEYLAVSRIFTGHIALNLLNAFYTALFPRVIIGQLQKQLYSIQCNAKSLTSSRRVPRLNLIDCVLLIKSFYQFKKVMAKHQSKRVMVENNGLLYTHFYVRHYTPEQYSLQTLVVWIREECKEIEKLQETCLPTTDITLDYIFKIRKPEPIEVVNKMLKEILETTKFNQWYSVDPVIPDPKENGMFCKQYELDFRWILPKFCAIVRFTVNVDALTFDDEMSEDEMSEDNETSDDDESSGDESREDEMSDDDESTGDETTEDEGN